MNNIKDIAILLPVLNEEENLNNFEKMFLKNDYYSKFEYLFVDDGSNDGSKNIILDLSKRYKNVNYLFRENDKDISRSIIEGSKLIRSNNILLMDADFQHDLSNINKIVSEFYKKEFDVIIGSRFMENADNYRNFYNFSRLCLSKIFIFLSKIAINHNLTDPLSGFGILKKSVINYDGLYANGWKILFDIILTNKNIKYKEIGIIINPRKSGKSKIRFKVVKNFISLIFFHRKNAK